jgi:hypothetical protein
MTSYYRTVCGLEAPGDLWDRARAFEELTQTTHWWYPHRDFLLLCERPIALHWEHVRRGGRIVAQLHRGDGPAISWADGWSIHASHGRRVPGWVLTSPARITVQSIEEERNTEVRRVMLEQYGWSRFISDCRADVVDAVPASHPIRGLAGARLLRKELPGDPEPLVYLEMVNTTAEADGSHRRYLERINPGAYGGAAGRLCHAAMASRWHHRDARGALVPTFERWQDYLPTSES